MRRCLRSSKSPLPLPPESALCAAGCRFPGHTHDLGEKFLVLEGVFSDEHGEYGPGTYVRNPPGSPHAPWSDAGHAIHLREDRASAIRREPRMNADASACSLCEQAPAA